MSVLQRAFVGLATIAVVSHPVALPAVPIEYRAHLPIVQAEINGQGPFDVVVDTGADVTVLDAALVAQLSLQIVGSRPVGSPMADKHESADVVRLTRLRIGDAVIEDLEAVSMDLASIFSGIDAPHAVISAASFEGWLTTIDLPQGQMILRKGSLPEPDGKRILAYTAENAIPHIPVSVGTADVIVALDTGAPSGVSMPLDYQERLELESAPQVVGMGRTVDATFEIRAANLDGALVVGAARFERPRITFNERSPKPLLGMEVLGEFRITIDRTHRRIELVRGSAKGAPQAMNRMVRRASGTRGYGIKLRGLSGDALEVIGLDERSVASQAGLRPGDRIVRMNGDSVASLDTNQRIARLRGSPLRLHVERGGELIEIALSLEPE